MVTRKRTGSLNYFGGNKITREEQIKKQADIYTDDSSNYAEWSDDGGWSDINDIELIEKAFIEGAKWADKTMIEKTCNWLKNIMYIQTDYEEDIDGCGCTFNFLTCDFDSVDEFIEYFKKAMEK